MRLPLALLLCSCAAPVRDVRLDVAVVCPGVGQGRGVVVSPMHVLVTRHQAEACPGTWYANGTRMHLAAVSTTGDAATLASTWEAWETWAVPGPAPLVGATVCSLAGCGKVLARTGDGFLWDRRTGHGDSGAGVFDSKNRLVGIVVGAGTYVADRDSWRMLLEGLPRVCLNCEWADGEAW